MADSVPNSNIVERHPHAFQKLLNAHQVTFQRIGCKEKKKISWPVGNAPYLLPLDCRLPSTENLLECPHTF